MKVWKREKTRRRTQLSVSMMMLAAAALSLSALGCATREPLAASQMVYQLQAPDYEAAGLYFGRKLYGEGWRPCPPGDHRPLCQPDGEFVQHLWRRLDYFHANSELREAFKRGFRIGYPARIADLVLGPHVAAAAGATGIAISSGFVSAIDTFQKEWSTRISQAVDVFVLLLMEGSPEDQQWFIQGFLLTYEPKYKQVQDLIKNPHVLCQNSEGGTPLCIGYGRNEALAAPDLPPGSTLRTQIYRQTFCVMGDELGRRLSTNLIKRSDLVDVMRRAKAALLLDPGEYTQNLRGIFAQFNNRYSTDGRSVFLSVLKEAELELVEPDTSGRCGR